MELLIEASGEYLIITRPSDGRSWITPVADLDDPRYFSAFSSKEDAESEVSLREGEARDAKYDDWG